jgi:hypothetical protein
LNTFAGSHVWLRNSAKLRKSTIQSFSKPLKFNTLTLELALPLEDVCPDVTAIGNARERVDAEDHEDSERRSGV